MLLGEPFNVTLIRTLQAGIILFFLTEKELKFYEDRLWFKLESEP